MMNKWMRCCLGLMFLMGANGFSWAACERELEAYVVANTAFFKEMCQDGRWPSQSDDCTEAGVRTRIYETRSNPYGFSNMNPTQKEQELTRKRQTASNQQKIQGTRQAATNLAETMFNICVLEFGPPDIGKSTRQNQSAQQQAQQSQQQNQSTQQQSQSTQQQSQQAQQQAQQARAAQQQSQQAVFNSAQNQTAADQTRKSERRRHEPENEAHDCLSLDKSGLFGGIVNKCDFKVAYQFCNFNPKKDSWAESHTCGKSGGADFVGAGRTSAAHVKNTETVYWFACKDPAWPVDVEYVAGKGIQARCYTIGGK